MSRPRDRASASGLLPRMEARPWRDGKTTTYRFHPIDAPPINLGTDRTEALRRVLDMLGESAGVTIGELWSTYRTTPAWRHLAERTRIDCVSSLRCRRQRAIVSCSDRIQAAAAVSINRQAGRAMPWLHHRSRQAFSMRRC